MYYDPDPSRPEFRTTEQPPHSEQHPRDEWGRRDEQRVRDEQRRRYEQGQRDEQRAQYEQGRRDEQHRQYEQRGRDEWGQRDQPGMPRYEGNVWTVRIGVYIGLATLLWVAYALIFCGPH